MRTLGWLRLVVLVSVALLAAGCMVKTPVGSVYVYTEVNLLPGNPTQEGIPLAERTPTLSPGNDLTPTWTPPPTFTQIPTSTPATCSVTVIIQQGINKREHPSTDHPKIGSVAQGWVVTLDNVVVTENDFMWGRDASDGGWFVLRAWGTWWVKWNDECYYNTMSSED